MCTGRCGRFRPPPHPPRTLIRAKILSTRTYARIRAIPPSHRGRILTGKPCENRGNPGVPWHPRDSPDCSRIVYRQPQPGTGFSYRLSERVVRDNVMVANSFRLRGQLTPAIACMKGLTLFLETQRPRFHEIIADPTRALKEDANRRPHIRFTAQSLGELPEKWPYAQNDALGHALWFLRSCKRRDAAFDRRRLGSFPPLPGLFRSHRILAR